MAMNDCLNSSPKSISMMPIRDGVAERERESPPKVSLFGSLPIALLFLLSFPPLSHSSSRGNSRRRRRRERSSISMQALVQLPTWDFLLLLFSSFLLISPSLSDPRISEVELQCGNSTGLGNIIPAFTAMMRPISDQVTNQGWGSNSSSAPPTVLYGLAQCHGDLNQSDCLLCFAESRTKLPRCIPRTGGRLYLDGCFLRYDNYSFFNESIDPKHDE